MNTSLQGKKVAILATDGFEQVELTDPKKDLEEAGAEAEVISIKAGEIKGWDKTDWGKSVKVDKTLDTAKASDYDILVLPGGQINPDKLRIDEKAVACEGVCAVRQSRCSHLSWSLDIDRSWSSEGEDHDVVAFRKDRSAECRS